MKVYRIVLATLLALLMAAPAFAVNVKLKGDFREFFRYSNQMPLHNAGYDFDNLPAARGDGSFDTRQNDKDSDFRFSQRLRLTWVAEDDEKKVRGTFGAEFDVTAGYGEDGSTRNGIGGGFEGDRTNFELRLAYIDFELPFDPASRVYMGLMPVEMNAFVFCDNAMGVRLDRNMGDLNAAIGWFRNDTEDNDNWGGDARSNYGDLYTLDLKYDLGAGNKLAAFAYYMDDGREPNISYSNDRPIPDIYWDDTTRTYWTGLAGAFEAGNLFGGFTAIYQGGKAYGNAFTGGDSNIRAYLLNAEGTVKIDRSYVQLGWIYSTGDDDQSDGTVKNFFSIDTDNSLIGSVALLEKYDWNAVVYGPYIGYLGMNHIYLNLGYEFSEKTDGRLGFIWFNTDEDVDGEALWGNNKKDTNIGYEINAEVNHAITENLSFGLAAGYLIGDDGWDALASDGNSDDLWNVISRVRFKF